MVVLTGQSGCLHLPRGSEFPRKVVLVDTQPCLDLIRLRPLIFEDPGEEMQMLHFLLCLSLQVMLPV